MRHATLEDFDKLKSVFKQHRDVFPYLRFDGLKVKIETGKVIYDKGVIITYNRYQRKQKLGQKCIAEKGDIVVQEIVKEEGGHPQDVWSQFVKYVDSPIWLTVRRDNYRAKQFYEKVGMRIVGDISWSNGKIPGDVYFQKVRKV